MRNLIDIGLVILVIILLLPKKKKRKTQLCLTIIINKSQIKILAMKIEIKTFVDTMLALVDHDTQEPIDATFSNIQLESSDPNIFTADTDPNNDGVVDVVGVGAGDGILKVTADAAYTNPKTGEPATEIGKTVDVPVTITAPPPGALVTDLIVSFSAPQPV